MTDEADLLMGKRAALETRARILRAVRGFFDDQGFLEVETPARVENPGQELHLDALAVSGAGPGRAPRFLITSPEHHMKRMLGAGYRRIFQICKAFRAGEHGPHHQPEFTMLEWYRADEPLERIADDCEVLLALAAHSAGRPAPARALRTTVADLMRRHAGVEIAGDESVADLRAKLVTGGVLTDARAVGAASWDDLFFQVFLDRVEPTLAGSGEGAGPAGRPTFVFDWPLPLAALARVRPDNHRVAERFELYAGGLELANAFGELTDAREQRSRFEAENAERRARGKTVYPLDERLLAALERMPPTAGVALGFDRLVMWALGSPRVADVIAFSDE